MNLNPDQVRRTIESLIVRYPELKDDEETWRLTLESESNTFECLRQIERKRQETDCLIDAIQMNMDELKTRKARFERREEAMRALAFEILQAADLRKAELPEATLSIANGKPRVIITDDTKLPPDCWRVKREPNKTRIAELFAAGTTVYGATLSNAEPHLVVRTR